MEQLTEYDKRLLKTHRIVMAEDSLRHGQESPAQTMERFERYSRAERELVAENQSLRAERDTGFRENMALRRTVEQLKMVAFCLVLVSGLLFDAWWSKP
jgi:hypothetical protein